MNETDDKTYSWDDRIDDFMSILYNKVKDSKDSNKFIPNKIFLNVSLLSTLIFLFFVNHENNDDDIFVQIKDKAKDITCKEIVETELNYWIRKFQPIKKLLLEYLVIQENDIRVIHITNLVEKCNLFFEEISKNEKIMHLIPFTVTFAIMHFTVLRESLKLQTSNFGINEFKEIISRYKDHFTNSFNQFFAWRTDQITTKTSISNDLNSTSLFTFQANGEVKDKVCNKTVNYFAKSSNDQIFIKVFDLIKLRMFTEAKADFMKMFLHIFSLTNFVHDFEPSYNISWPLSISSFWVGPYGIDTFPDGSHNFDDNSKIFYNISEDESGVITKIEIRCGGIVDHIQAFYEDGRVGKKIGNGGGSKHVVSDLDKSSKYIVAVKLMFGLGLLGTIEFIFNDGNTTGLLGSLHENDHDITGSIQIGPFGKHNKFRLSSIMGGGGKIRINKDYGENVAHVAFKFQHIDSV
ncbi:uncharacterized protein OCT59_010258 [Rhizophagus irregularis]|nr:hypothetical protein GLOIN_2v1838075 [Rhizophagus irregularis DAOM 181602=DAOM 197198]UZO18951.1 hypothetical protein OCT59_010258 [Rhizophagus irregularis]POG76562.1 hypothetical protein GLOIN_2v1838075 [Rhizophagus irregularis DAOM 181602=DAOM 197198]CAB4495232.1 unnamed protein product [Rhizophagus irregularis]CAB5093814.1 unnamed protein product [Rhizophagus irregularis]CAB5382096.1 unnamed protein product [Rhizophagus irregularis]|eukprot:XP_025183428.1 hypothetical protein GLOIN_2v1838075 [Rhizophagus irregularis DAOM 181602=DAOM 197198]